ncbi:MAG: ABC transporter permease [Candidatus Eisenbacteria bacterium]|nr:ABC transporter permease [Candidatus Eisenbacteria bacterium]
MTAADLLGVSIGNLWRMKLRTFLTLSGVIIAVGAFVAMLSFGAGNRRTFNEQAESLGLFQTMHVYPAENEEGEGPFLDAAALESLAALPGVRLAYPFQGVDVTVRTADSVFTAEAQALPAEAARTRMYTRLAAGTPPGDDQAKEALVTEEFLDMAGIGLPDSALGLSLIVEARRAVLDSAMIHALDDPDGERGRRLAEVRVDSLLDPGYRRRVLRREAGDAAARFLDGFLNARETVRDTLTVSGVLRSDGPRRLRIPPLLIPEGAARRFEDGFFAEDPAELFVALRRGALFDGPRRPGPSYAQITLDLDPRASHAAVGDSIRALGFRAFSYAERFAEMRRFFFYFDLALAAVGMVALVTASLGIVNTMVMSISERRREIGVLKSLGADDRDIRVLFLVESAVIGVVGSLAGIGFGWLVARIASFAARLYMEREGLPAADLFATPLWLSAIALAIGLAVSLLAGSYPAARAARVDPVEALRSE